jgi:hypothetical protein
MIVIVLGASVLVLAATAAGKEFQPGDLRVCSATRCVAIENQAVLDRLAALYYGDPKPRRVSAPRLHAPYFQLRFTNGYVTGIVATRRLDRFLSYGVNLGQFERGRWYHVPAAAAAELQRLTLSLRPLRLTQTALAKAH